MLPGDHIGVEEVPIRPWSHARACFGAGLDEPLCTEHLKCLPQDRPTYLKLKTQFRFAQQSIAWFEIAAHNTQAYLPYDLFG